MTPHQRLYRTLRRAGLRRDEARDAVPRLMAAKDRADVRAKMVELLNRRGPRHV